MIYEFEFDLTKSEANKAKHGIDFVEAQQLWEDDSRLTFSANPISEPRFGLTANLNGINWTAIYTLRGATIRIISVRRARQNEVEDYESNVGRRI